MTVIAEMKKEIKELKSKLKEANETIIAQNITLKMNAERYCECEDMLLDFNSKIIEALDLYKYD